MNDVLYHKSMALCSLPYEKVRLRNTSADGYLYQVIADTEADWVINIDEDAFVSDIDALKRLLAYCRENIAKYAMPYDIAFKEDMPKTLVGKVAYRKLEEEELQNQELAS